MCFLQFACKGSAKSAIKETLGRLISGDLIFINIYKVWWEDWECREGRGLGTKRATVGARGRGRPFCERRSFTFQKAVNRTVKGRLLQAKRRPFATRCATRRYAGSFSAFYEKLYITVCLVHHNSLSLQKRSCIRKIARKLAFRSFASSL